MTKEKRGRGRTSAGEIQAKHTREDVAPTELEVKANNESIEHLKVVFAEFLERHLQDTFLFGNREKIAIDFCDTKSFDFDTMAKKKWGADKVYVTLSTKTVQDYLSPNIKESLEPVRRQGGSEFQNEPVHTGLWRIKVLSVNEPMNLAHVMALAKNPLIVPSIMKGKERYLIPTVILGKDSTFVLTMKWNPMQGRMIFHIIGLDELWKSDFYIPTIPNT
jgi:hypothetical protein